MNPSLTKLHRIWLLHFGKGKNKKLKSDEGIQQMIKLQHLY